MRPARLAARRYFVFSASSSFSLPAITLFKSSATSRLSAYFVSAFFERQEVSGEQGLVGRHGDVRLHPGPLPVRLGHRIDRPAERYARAEVVGDPIDRRPVGTAAGRFPDDRRPLQRLHIVGERLGRRERPVAGQDVQVLVRELLAPATG